MSTRKIAILKDTALYAAANYLSQAIGILNSFLLRSFVGPVGMGVWGVLQVILGYCGYASLGTTRALARDYPFLRGQQKFEEADRLKDNTLTFSILMSVIPALALLGFALVKFPHLEKSFLIGILFLVGFLFIQRYYDFLITLLRSDKEFKVLSKQVVWNAVGGILVTVLFVKAWQIYGLYAGTAVLTVGLILFLHRERPYTFRIQWDKTTILKELKLGLPLVASAFLYTFLLGLDKLLLAKKIGFYEVGLYSIAMMASNYILSLPMMFSNVLYPNLLELYGEKKEDLSQIVSYLEKPVCVLAVLVPFLCAMAFAAMPFLVGLFLKKFIPGLTCMKIYLVGAFFLLMGQFANNFLVTIDKYLRIIPVLIAAIALNFLFNLVFIGWGWGVEGVAAGTVLSYAVYGIGTYFLALREICQPGQAVSRILKNLLLFGSFFAGIFLIDLWGPSSGSLLKIALSKGVLFLFLAVPYLYFLERREHLLKTVWTLLADKFLSKKS